MLAELNADQHAAATHPAAGGPLLVVAGAGTGKTLTLASRLAWLVQQGASPQRLLLITFSRRAAAEMGRRAGRLLHQALQLPSSTPPPHLPWCGTFHSVAARLLRDEAPRIGLDPGFTVLDRADAQDLMALTRQSLGLAAQADGDAAGGLPGSGARFPLAPTCLAILSRCINTRVPLAEVLSSAYPWCAAAQAGLARLFSAFAEAKQQQHSLDFDDLLQAWWHLMQHPELARRVRSRFDHVLVDEVQDINRLQADVLLALKPDGKGMTAVGDDAQSIYGFRGASVRHILDFPQRFSPPATVLTLERNYRASQPLLVASNAVIALAAERFDKRLWSPRVQAPRPRLVTVEDEAAQARAVADAVLAEREAGLQLKRQAVLFRTGAHSLALEMELARRNIPFVKYGGLRFFEAAHVKDVLAVLRWADNPLARLAALRAARLVPGLGPASVRKLLDHLAGGAALAAFQPPPAARAGWAALHALMQQLRGPQARWPDDLQAVITWYTPHAERLHADARVRLGELQQLAMLATGHASRERFVTEITLDPPAAAGDESGVPMLDEDYLILSTIHSAKGQEWNAVHVLNVVDGCMPADMATGSAAEIEEERRLLYVAMTRARDTLTLWVPQRFHVTQQRALGDRHLYAPMSRFLPPAVVALFDTGLGGCETPPAASAAQAPAHAHDADLAAPAAAHEPAAPWLDLGAALRQGWA
jgi:DNA helicase-2/ATP-dependent DNA helicase PcrA